MRNTEKVYEHLDILYILLLVVSQEGFMKVNCLDIRLGFMKHYILSLIALITEMIEMSAEETQIMGGVGTIIHHHRDLQRHVEEVKTKGVMEENLVEEVTKYYL